MFVHGLHQVIVAAMVEDPKEIAYGEIEVYSDRLVLIGTETSAAIRVFRQAGGQAERIAPGSRRHRFSSLCGQFFSEQVKNPPRGFPKASYLFYRSASRLYFPRRCANRSGFSAATASS